MNLKNPISVPFKMMSVCSHALVSLSDIIVQAAVSSTYLFHTVHYHNMTNKSPVCHNVIGIMRNYYIYTKDSRCAGRYWQREPSGFKKLRLH